MKFIKMFLKKYLPLLIFFSALGVFILGYIITNHQTVLMYLIGYARVYTKLSDAVVKEDGVELPNAKVFIMDDGDKLLIYSPESKKSYKVLIVDKIVNDIGETNAGEDCYDLVLNSYLFQSDNAYGIVYASSAKWGMNPHLNISDKQISYTTQKLENGKYIDVNHQIIFKGE